MIPYKDDNPTEKFPIITILLIGSNIGVYLFFLIQPELVYQQAVFELGMIPREIWTGVNLSFLDYLNYLRGHGVRIPFSPPAPYLHPISPYLSLFSSMFMHGGFAHLAGNMLYLWIFGNNVEDYLGHFKFLVLYFFWGLVASLAHLLANPSSVIPTVGASGAISGVLGAYLVLFPWARVYVLVPAFFYFFTTTMPAGLILVFWFLFQVLAALPSTSAGGAGVAYWAHIGGFVAGYLWLRLFKKRPVRKPYGFRTRSYRGFYR